MPGEIIVTAPYSVFLANWQNPTLAPSLQAQARFIWFNNLPTVTKEDDVVDAEIVVTGNRLKARVTTIAMNLDGRSHINPVLPCIGTTSGKEIASLAIALRFKLTNKDFGPGRAGENGIGSAGSTVPVAINTQHLKGYDQLVGGLDYLVGHEIAHGLKPMQEYNQQMWTQYINGAGKGLTADQQKAQYPNSAEFKANEARANTVGKALLEQLNNANIPSPGFTPNNGYATC